MLSKGLIKLINSLNYKKYREKHQLFIAEGEKLVFDLIKMGAPLKYVFSEKQIVKMNPGTEFIQCKEGELGKISFLKNSPGIIALVKYEEQKVIPGEILQKFSIALDGIQDPGNMGTIIRLANWFGIEHIICSNDCVDIYNPKVVQASMGALLGVKITYTHLPEFVKALLSHPGFGIYGAYMQGESIYQAKLGETGLLVMGSEGKGISTGLERLVNRKISIPSFHKGDSSAESLNVAIATGIIVSEFARQHDPN